MSEEHSDTKWEFFFPPLREEKRPFAKLSSGIPPASPWARACVTSGGHRCAGKAFPHSHIPSWPCAPGPVTGSLQSCSADPSPVTSDPRPEVSRYSFSVSRFAFPGYFYPWPCRSRGWLCVWTFPASILHLVKLLLALYPTALIHGFPEVSTSLFFHSETSAIN